MGLFSALDLLLFFLCFDLSIVGMYFVIAGWGHENARAAATKFFLYTVIRSYADERRSAVAKTVSRATMP